MDIDNRILKEFSKLEKILKELIIELSCVRESESCFIVELGGNSIRYRLQPLYSRLISQQFNVPLCSCDYAEERKKGEYYVSPMFERSYHFSYSAHDMLHWCIKDESIDMDGGKDKYYATEDIAKDAQYIFKIMGSKRHPNIYEEDPRITGKSKQSFPDDEFLDYIKKPRLKE